VELTIHTPDSAPEASKEALNGLIKAFGWAPNVLGVFAGSPVLVQSYQALTGVLAKDSAFTPTEQEIIQVANNIANDCSYCMAAHSTVIQMKELLSEDQLEALRTGAPLVDPKQEALRLFALAVLNKKGRVSEAETADFKSAGYTVEHVLEIIVHTAFKVITNYTNNLVEPELDEPFAAQKWSSKQLVAAGATSA